MISGFVISPGSVSTFFNEIERIFSSIILFFVILLTEMLSTRWVLIICFIGKDFLKQSLSSVALFLLKLVVFLS